MSYSNIEAKYQARTATGCKTQLIIITRNKKVNIDVPKIRYAA